ncbi:MAG: hypothetical protein ABFD89_08210, partial [Bryobacteraceae bacterium]
MRLILASLLIFVPLAAQQPTPAQPAQETQAPAPAAEQWLTGNIDFGYRWVSDVSGSFDTYRSVVNLGDGPKLLGLDLTLEDKRYCLFDTARIRAHSWGGDPYNTAQIDVRRRGIYDLSVDYRNLSYFNALPSYADPTISQGIFLNQNSYDTHRRMLDIQLDLMPGRRIIPYFAFTRDWGSGASISDFFTDTNEFPIRRDLRDRTNHFRGGVRVELNRFHATIEQGGTNFKDHQRLFYSDDPNYGNRTSKVLGTVTQLSTLEQNYRIDGDSMYSKGLVTASPLSWVNVSAQFLYSKPSSDVNYSHVSTGSFVSFDPFLFYSSQQVFTTAESKQPHTSGSFGAELRLHRRIRLIESIVTDRFHTSGTGLLDQTFVTAAGTSTSGSGVLPGLEKLVFNYNRQEANLLVDVLPKLTLRGGHRYVWGDAQVRAGVLSQTGSVETGEMKMNVGLAGFTYRAVQKITVNGEFEGGSACKNYFRTSLQDYQRGRVRIDYRLLKSLNVGARFTVLNNQNPSDSIRYDFLNRDNSLTVYWTPSGGKLFTLLGDYSRSSLRSDILYLVPNTLQSELFAYRENAHTGTALIELKFPSYLQKASPRLALGGSFFKASGSRPTEYYQPVVKFSVP